MPTCFLTRTAHARPSAIVGTKEFIDRARWFRKAFGGGIRQSGGIAAAADYAITHHFPRLAGTHALARRLQEGLKELGCDILAPVETNMVSRNVTLNAGLGASRSCPFQVFFDPAPIGLTLDSVMARLKALPEPILVMRERLVVHHQSSPQAVEDFIAVVAEMKKEREAGGHPEKEQVDDPMLEEGKLRRQAALGY